MSGSVFGPGYYSDGGSSSSRTYYVESTAQGLKWKGDYSAIVSYIPNDMVRYSEAVYLCTQSALNHLPTETDYFAKMIEYGTDGINGINGTSFTWRGEYLGGSTYNPKDVIKYNGSVYVCVNQTAGNLPTNVSYWSYK